MTSSLCVSCGRRATRQDYDRHGASREVLVAAISIVTYGESTETRPIAALCGSCSMRDLPERELADAIAKVLKECS